MLLEYMKYNSNNKKRTKKANKINKNKFVAGVLRPLEYIILQLDIDQDIINGINSGQLKGRCACRFFSDFWMLLG